MIKARIDFSTKSIQKPTYSVEMEFNDDTHLSNYLAKANREGKKVIGHEVLSEPCVYVIDIEDWIGEGLPSINYAKEYGVRMTIEEFTKAFNNPEEYEGVNQTLSHIIFENYK